ncbi:hypothetical protein [Streptosporangium sp. LJ11]|uniref:hypothetical protein n=1 Tax=Streptosporangium sp. LJ11 TaxID=3436927 RepID=UPI003F7A6028
MSRYGWIIAVRPPAASRAAWASASFRSPVLIVSRAPAEIEGLTTYSSRTGKSTASPGPAQ